MNALRKQMPLVTLSDVYMVTNACSEQNYAPQCAVGFLQTLIQLKVAVDGSCKCRYDLSSPVVQGSGGASNSPEF